jgi:predicted phage-related endonuclease
MDRSTFLAERRKGIGGSDIAAVFNVGYGCRRRLWYDKRDVPRDFPDEGNALMELGNVLEPFFAAKYEKQTGRAVSILHEPVVHKTVDCLRVNVDRMVFDETGPRGPLEIKSVGRAVFYKVKREGLPSDYILQLQQEMLVTDFPTGSYAIGCRDNGELVTWDVDRNEALCAEILAEGPKFWAQVENGPIPDALDSDDRRCQECGWRTTCQGNNLVQLGPESEYTVDESLAGLAAEYVERRALRKEADDLLEEVKEELACKLGDRTMVMAGGVKIQYYNVSKKEYTVKASSTRQLRLYPPKK